MFKKINISSKTLSIQYPKWFFEAFHCAQMQPATIELNFYKKVNVQPSGFALLHILAQELKTLKIELRGCDRFLITPQRFPYHDSEYSMDYFEASLKPLFFDRFLEMQTGRISDDRAFDLQLLFSELTQNAKDHSGSERYLVFLTANEVGVFDLGVSIPAKLEQKYSFKDDIEAIEFSLKEGVTTRRLRSGGFGLFYTLDMLKKNDGQLYIASRNGQLRRYLKNKKIDRKVIDPKMPGTLIYCHLGLEKGKKR